MAKIPYEDRWIGKIERFNKKFPPGTSVIYTAPGGMRFKTSIRYPAVVLHGAFSVIWLVNIRNYVRFDRVVVV